MANISYWFGSWVSGWESGGSPDLRPGETHNWTFWGFKYGDAVSVTAHPVVLINYLEERVLNIENVRIEGDLSGSRLYFTVRNSGSNSVPGYGLGFSIISQ
ncbi:hypothetical protein [Mucilaginibacter sp.]|uniref:hypothetical protein n=1 Tax=Mucilaginibacter sp. TaxID=1882438 RepID=UPI002633564A|nr:hypothetical protein [Mucilaginibacter sp.]